MLLPGPHHSRSVALEAREIRLEVDTLGRKLFWNWKYVRGSCHASRLIPTIYFSQAHHHDLLRIALTASGMYQLINGDGSWCLGRRLGSIGFGQSDYRPMSLDVWTIIACEIQDGLLCRSANLSRDLVRHI